MSNPRFWALVSLTLAVAMTRVIPHPWNFTPVGALCLFGGAYFTHKWTAFGVPLAALFLSDLVLAVTTYNFQSLVGMPVVYFTFALIVCLGMLLRGRPRVLPIVGAALAAGLLHFLITNFPGLLPGHNNSLTWNAVMASYAAGLPFLQNMLYANLVFCGLLFGGFAWAQTRFPALREQTALAN
jgi:hypothetical protein